MDKHTTRFRKGGNLTELSQKLPTGTMTRNGRITFIATVRTLQSPDIQRLEAQTGFQTTTGVAHAALAM